MASELHGRYTLLSNLGHGSFATVFLARDSENHGNLVAIKAISTEGFTDEEYSEMNTQFLQEAAFLMQLQHPGLPHMIEFFADGACYYLVMEWIAGKTMTQTVRENGRPSQDTVLDWGIQLCDIISYLHSHKPYPIILGDLKPSNAMITYDGRVKIIDFGVARYLAPSQNPRTFEFVSPGFSAPEKYFRFDCDLRGDIYSLGATLYWALTEAKLEKMQFEIPPLRKLMPEANHWLESLLIKCMEYVPEHRFQTIDEVKKELVLARNELKGRQDRARENSGNLLAALYKNKENDSLL